MSAAKLPRVEAALLALALAAGLGLRLLRIDEGRMSPDEGNYLFSARVHRLERAGGPAAWLAEDAEWVWPRYYPHSYLHQLLARWAYRLGAGSVQALRGVSAVLGALTPLAAFLLAARALRARDPARPQAAAGALLAGAVVALQCLHVWYSRTGWGQTGCTAFFALYLLLGHRLFERERSLARDALLAAGMAAAALLAYGWHEMVVVLVAGTGAFVLWHHAAGGAGFAGRGLARLPRTLLGSRKAWLALASALPVAALFGALFTSEFARRHWLGLETGERAPWGENLLLSLRFLFPLSHLERQLGWPVLLLAGAGLVALRRRDPFAFRYLACALLASPLLFLLLFQDPGLVRIYLPAAVALAVLAGEGLAALAGLLPTRAARPAALAAVLLLSAWHAGVTWHTVFGAPDAPLFERAFHAPDGAALVLQRDAHDATLAALRERLAPGEVVGVSAERLPGGGVKGEFSALFRLRDAGVAAEPCPWDGPRARWPRLVMGLDALRGRPEHPLADGGAYRAVATDAFGRFSLFERARGGGG